MVLRTEIHIYILSGVASIGPLRPHIGDFMLSPAAIRTSRIKHRTQQAKEVKESFAGTAPLVLHWDGVVMEDSATRSKVDRLPILVSGRSGEKLLTVA